MMHFVAKYSNIAGVAVVADGFIVLENYKSSVGDVPYLYKLNLKGEIVWERQQSDSAFSFLNLYIRDGKILVNNGTGEAELNPDTGALTNWVLTR